MAEESEWIYCSDKQPPKRGRYEVAIVSPPRLKGESPTVWRTFALWMRRPGYRWESGERGGIEEPYAWRPIRAEEPAGPSLFGEAWLSAGLVGQQLAREGQPGVTFSTLKRGSWKRKAPRPDSPKREMYEKRITKARAARAKDKAQTNGCEYGAWLRAWWKLNGCAACGRHRGVVLHHVKHRAPALCGLRA